MVQRLLILIIIYPERIEKPLYSQVFNPICLELKYFNTDPEYIKGLSDKEFKDHKEVLKTNFEKLTSDSIK